MIQITSREFREQQAAYFAKADAGERVVILRRGKRAYVLVPVNDDDFEISPALKERINNARKELQENNTRHFDNVNDLTEWMENL